MDKWTFRPTPIRNTARRWMSRTVSLFLSSCSHRILRTKNGPQDSVLSFVGQILLRPHHPEFGGDPRGLVEIKRSAYAKITWRSTAR
jgi:hypothetical protein